MVFFAQRVARRVCVFDLAITRRDGGFTGVFFPDFNVQAVLLPSRFSPRPLKGLKCLCNISLKALAPRFLAVEEFLDA